MPCLWNFWFLCFLIWTNHCSCFESWIRNQLIVSPPMSVTANVPVWNSGIQGLHSYDEKNKFRIEPLAPTPLKSNFVIILLCNENPRDSSKKGESFRIEHVSVKWCNFAHCNTIPAQRSFKKYRSFWPYFKKLSYLPISLRTFDLRLIRNVINTQLFDWLYIRLIIRSTQRVMDQKRKFVFFKLQWWLQVRDGPYSAK